MKKEIIVFMACHQAGGEPTIVAAKVKATDDQINNGRHYALAREIADEEGYQGGFVFFDEIEAPVYIQVALKNDQIHMLN